MGENSSHAPGHAIEEGGVRQRELIGTGGAPMSGNFGVGPLPGTKTAGRHGGGKSDGMVLGDSSRANPPGIDMGSGSMKATANSRHGSH